jgi:hypothetical protein
LDRRVTLNLDDFDTFAHRLYADAMAERFDWGEEKVPFSEWYSQNVDFLMTEYKDTRGTSK